MIAIMITIIVFHCGFPELERFESVTFILPCHLIEVTLAIEDASVGLFDVVAFADVVDIGLDDRLVM